MHGSRFQKWHKQKKSPRWPQCHKWHCHHRGHLFLYTCAGRSKPLLSVFILPSSYSRKYRRMQDTASVSLCLRLFLAFLIFPAFKPTCLPLPCRAMANKSVFRQCAAGGTPVTASHAHMTMTVTGLPSRWQESGAFPLYRCAAPCLFPWRVAPSYPLPFPFRLYIYASVSMPPSGQHQCVIFVAGAKVKTGLGTQIFCRKISTPFQG